MSTLFTGKGLLKMIGIAIKDNKVKKNSAVENFLILFTE